MRKRRDLAVDGGDSLCYYGGDNSEKEVGTLAKNREKINLENVNLAEFDFRDIFVKDGIKQLDDMRNGIFAKSGALKNNLERYIETKKTILQEWNNKKSKCSSMLGHLQLCIAER